VPAHPLAGLAKNRPPDYPEAARRRREQGRVVIRVAVSEDGVPMEVAVAVSSGHPPLDAAAMAAVQRWRFAPATRAGRPIPGNAEVPIDFRLAE